jgi:hypothetical protein
MNTADLKKTLKYFSCFHEGEVFDYGIINLGVAKSYFHNVEDYFGITIFNETGEVYQSGTEADVIGIELKTFEDLKIRYKSFTGYDIDDPGETL